MALRAMCKYFTLLTLPFHVIVQLFRLHNLSLCHNNAIAVKCH